MESVIDVCFLGREVRYVVKTCKTDEKCYQYMHVGTVKVRKEIKKSIDICRVGWKSDEKSCTVYTVWC